LSPGKYFLFNQIIRAVETTVNIHNFDKCVKEYSKGMVKIDKRAGKKMGEPL
jgi:hypothetical protein